MDEPQVEARLREAARGLRLLPLRCQTRGYAWGGYDFIPALLGVANHDRQPFAELWAGAHPIAPSLVMLAGASAPLDQVLTRAPDALLGPEVAARFDRTLPYLLKVLDVRGMLSIQAHPDKRQAEEGFRRENADGIPLDAGRRNYRDARHKPEATVALTEFWMLYGFKPLEEIADTLDGVLELQPIAPAFRGTLAAAGADASRRDELLRSLYQSVMTGPQPVIDRVLGPLLARLATPEARAKLRKNSADFWAVRAADQFPLPDGHLDRGIISIYLLNLVRLEPGQGVCIPAGLLHAHLEGRAVEIMANSDNVLRGGLTPKHVDVPELLRALKFQSAPPVVLGGERMSGVETRYGTSAAEFQLSRLDLAAGEPYHAPAAWGADVLLAIVGRAEVRGGAEVVPLERGAAVLVPNGLAYEVCAAERATIFKASVPHPL